MSKNRSGPGGGGTPAPTRLPITVVDTWSNSGAYGIGVPVSPANVGDLMVLFISIYSRSQLTSSVSGGGIPATGPGSWQRLSYEIVRNASQASELWVGVVGTTGPSNITLVTTGASNIKLMASELEAGTSPNWTCYGNTGQGIYYIGTVYSWETPFLAPQGSTELYMAFVSTGIGDVTITTGSLTPTAIVYCGGLFPNTAAIAYAPDVVGVSNYFGASGTYISGLNYDQLATLIYATT